jgi:hypothetical protein
MDILSFPAILRRSSGGGPVASQGAAHLLLGLPFAQVADPISPDGC